MMGTNASRFIRRWSMRTRLLCVLGFALLCLAANGLVGYFGMAFMQSSSQEAAGGATEDLKKLADLRAAIGNVRRYEKDMIIHYENAEALGQYRTKWQAALKDADDTIKALMGSRHASSEDDLKAAAASLGEYFKSALPVVKQLEASAYDNATAANKTMGRAKSHIYDTEKRLDAAQRRIEEDVGLALASIEGVRQRSVAVFLVVVIGGTLVLLGATLVNLRSICDPVDAARQVASEIAAGNLTGQIDTQGEDEAAQLLVSLHHMQQSLLRTIGSVRDSVQSITMSSAEVAVGNADLATRTEQAASNLQQTASSMEQLTGTVKQTADSARTANQLAHSAQTTAAKGGEVVSQVVSTMEEINASSKKIADIIAVIDGIAFQTNILALNAAVEAARAGEQGRGFAVVASEVRSLAQRSANAAKEIKGLIGASVEKVESGTRLVADAGQTMSEIVGSVQRVSDIINEITAAAAEQSDGIGQVNQAVTTLDQMTQQNAALVEQSTAAAQSLKDQANRLSSSVSIFRLDALAPA